MRLTMNLGVNDMSVNKILKILNFSKDVLKKSYSDDGYRFDPRGTSYSIVENGYDPGEFYDENQIYDIFKLANVNAKPLKDGKYIVGFDIDKPDFECLNHTLDMLHFTEDLIKSLDDDGVFVFTKDGTNISDKAFDINNNNDVSFFSNTLYRSGFNFQLCRDEHMLVGFVTYNPDSHAVYVGKNGLIKVNDNIVNIKRKSDVSDEKLLSMLNSISSDLSGFGSKHDDYEFGG